MDKKERFIAAIQEHEGLLFKVASVYTNTAEDKQDLVQEIIYQLWKSFDTFSGKSSISTWMYRVALNTSIYHLKLAKRNVPTVPMATELGSYAAEDNTAVEQKWLLFRQHIDKLNPLDKAIVMLYFDNKSYQEIAEITGLTASNVGTKLGRIKEKLKSQVTKQG